MRDTTIAESYAETLFELALRHDALEPFAAAFRELSELLEREPRVRVFLETPKVEAATKKQVVAEALRGRVPPLFLNFVLVVIDKRRQRLLLQVGRAYGALLDAHLGRVHVQVTFAREPDERLEEDVTAELSRVLAKKVVPHVRVNPHILGGVVIRYGDRVMDGSLRRRLLSMRRQLMAAALPLTRNA